MPDLSKMGPKQLEALQKQARPQPQRHGIPKACLRAF